MESKHIKYNNLTMVLYTMVDVLKHCGRMDMVRMTILIALLQDDAIVDLLQEQGETLNFVNFRVLNKKMMANINKRFYHTLPLMVNATAILMDAGFITIMDGELIVAEGSDGDSFVEIGSIGSNSAQRIDSVMLRMLNICEEVTTKRMIKTLNIEI